jgi:hypothetical protein
MERSSAEIWAEVLRTAAVIRGHQPTIDRVEEKIMSDRLGGDDASALAQIVSDAIILAGLVEQLERRTASFD